MYSNTNFISDAIDHLATIAITMYRKMGYSVYRRVLSYYDGEEDAFDMRKPLSRDSGGLSVVPLKAPILSKDLMASR